MNQNQIAVEIKAAEDKLAALRSQLSAQRTGWWIFNRLMNRPEAFLGPALRTRQREVLDEDDKTHSVTNNSNVIFWGTF